MVRFDLYIFHIGRNVFNGRKYSACSVLVVVVVVADVLSCVALFVLWFPVKA